MGPTLTTIVGDGRVWHLLVPVTLLLVGGGAVVVASVVDAVSAR